MQNRFSSISATWSGGLILRMKSSDTPSIVPQRYISPSVEPDLSRSAMIIATAPISNIFWHSSQGSPYPVLLPCTSLRSPIRLWISIDSFTSFPHIGQDSCTIATYCFSLPIGDLLLYRKVDELPGFSGFLWHYPRKCLTITGTLSILGLFLLVLFHECARTQFHVAIQDISQALA